METTLYADPEHDGVRYAVIGFLLLGGVLAFFAIRAFFPDPLPDYATLLSCIGAVPVAFAISWAGEQALKRHWHSGRAISYTPNQITLNNAKNSVTIPLDGNISHLLWHFNLKGYARSGRERRLPNHWGVLACQVAHGKTEILVYTYASPNKIQQIVQQFEAFHEIYPKEVLEVSLRDRVTIPTDLKLPNKVLLGTDGRYWRAEKKRWAEGAELLPKDFETFIHFISQQS